MKKDIIINDQLAKQIISSRQLADRQSWDRKYKKLLKLVDEINTLSNKILELEEEKLPILDKIELLRNELTDDCVHPVDLCVPIENQTVLCKFCNKKIGFPHVKPD